MDCRHLERSAKQLGERHVGKLYLNSDGLTQNRS